MVVLREGMCPGLDADLVRDLRAADIKTVLLAQHAAFPVSGSDLYEELLDKLLDSGLFTGEITELSGGPGSGKSQVCFGVAVHVSLHLKQSVIFIDTTGGLTASRLLQMMQTESSNTEEQACAGSVKAVIVDSVSAVISPLLGGKQNEGMSLMIQVAGALKTMAKDFNVAALPCHIKAEFDLQWWSRSKDGLSGKRNWRRLSPVEK
ncbi:hypothetical protein F7725_006457 [Dissostichus mawsoni]|uniref:RecA family profile 1 domain-containing protein n=1 Tax=Dissostichus mawsoni TaxID=36200 RepID=A0A7J5XTZ1_DISMA|nr:hypothetical protein F7725_006457 [Dissostichus mawsoni]